MDREERPESDVDSTESSSDEESYEDVDENETEPTTCLFCAEVFPSVEKAIEHLDSGHNVNAAQLKHKFQMDQYSFIKFINYIRSEHITAETILQSESALWDDERYLKPGEYEPWLCYDFESLHTDASSSSPATTVTIPELMQRITDQNKLLQQANEDMELMRSDYKSLMKRMFDQEEVKQNNATKSDTNNGVVRNNPNLDSEYFKSYAHFGIHHEMLSDKVRTSSYRSALLDNAAFISEKTVLDVGCGTGILSIFASQAGAKRVVGIDNSEIVYTAMDIVRRNNIENVELIKGRLEDTVLPESKFDIIISEWMGYFLLFEGMLDSIIYARQHHLKPDGIILPNRCTLNIVGYGNKTLYWQHIEFWSDVYGVDMSNLKKRAIQEPLIEIVDPQFILTETEKIADFDIMTVDTNYSNFTHEFKLNCTKSGTLSGFVGDFDTLFELMPTKVQFGTASTDKPTHWKQTVFFIDEPQAVKKGDVINGKITSRRHRDDVRALEITIEAFGKKHKYTLN